MSEGTITKERLVADLSALGLRAGDVVLVHSALSSLGQVEGGALTVIHALLDVLGATGTLMMPTFGSPGPFDVKNTPSKLGAITEAFRTYPGVVRGFHPTHSVAVFGPRGQELIEGHLASSTAMGRHTPFGRLIALGGKILLLGVDNDRNTTMHTLEDYARGVYLSDYQATYLDEKGRVQLHRLKSYPGPHRNFIGVDPLLRKAGAMAVGKVGRAVCRLIDAKAMHDAVLDAFASDPALVLCDNRNCADCVMQRRKIREDRLRKEDFVLSALASSVSPYPDQIAVELQRAGIAEVVIDRLFDLPVWKLEEKLLRRASRVFAEEAIRVSAVACPADSSLLEKALTAARFFETDALIAPLAGPVGSLLEGATENGVNLYLENIETTAKVTLDILKQASAGKALAFNPAGFARVGEKPFLGVFSRSGLKRYIGMLMLSDGTFAGRPVLPGQGNGEVKELLSIMRCASFDGRVVLATGPGGPSFRELVEVFWTMMDGM